MTDPTTLGTIDREEMRGLAAEEYRRMDSLLRTLDFADWAELLRQLESQRNDVNRYFKELFHQHQARAQGAMLVYDVTNRYHGHDHRTMTTMTTTTMATTHNITTSTSI